jgi:hypothetical protein
MRLTATITFSDDDVILSSLRKYFKSGERNSNVIRRIISRHIALMESLNTPNPEIIRSLLDVTLHNIHLFNSNIYPLKSDLCSAIENSHFDKEKRDNLIDYIDKLDYPNYVRLIESVEQLI